MAGLRTVHTGPGSASVEAVVNVSQQLPMLTGGVWGATLRAFKETLVQLAGGLAGRGGCAVINGQPLKLQLVVRAWFRETALLFLKDSQSEESIN